MKKFGLLIFIVTFLTNFSHAQYSVNFEGTGETKTAYASGNVNLSSLNWNLTEALIGTEVTEIISGVRSARLRGYGTTSMSMLQDKTNGIGTISFLYRQYGTDTQVGFVVEYSVNGGTSWNQIGNEFTAIATVQTFSEVVNVSGNVRIRFRQASGTGTSNRRINIDDILVTDFVSSFPTLILNPTSLNGFTYFEGSGFSSEQSFTISGSNLTDDISITPPTNYEISTGTGGSFVATNPIPLTQSGGTVSSTTIYVRLAAGLGVGLYNGQTITAASTGATNATVTCNGAVTLPLPSAFINEIHYDNSGADMNEFVEVVIPVTFNTPVELAKFEIVLYNGSEGAVYNNSSLTNYTEGATEDGVTYYYFNYTADAGIQNGSPDGLALGYDGSLLQFLSYEGSFTATSGIANGVTSTDIGVLEDGTQAGMSLGLRTDLPGVWALLIAQTPGQSNALVFPVELTSFSATTIGKDVKLNWNTATEINNYGFEVERCALSAERQAWEKIGFVNGNGNSNSPKDYSFVDGNVTTGKYSYRLKQIDNDGQFEYSKTIEVDMNGVKKFELTQNYPNPFNPTTTISYILPQAGLVKLTLYNILGQEIRTLVNETKEAGTHTLNFDASDLNSGVYVYKIESGSFTQTKKMTLVK